LRGKHDDRGGTTKNPSRRHRLGSFVSSDFERFLNVESASGNGAEGPLITIEKGTCFFRSESELVDEEVGTEFAFVAL
jgi:hypothetical protein